METPLQITYRRMEPSDALSAHIRDEANELSEIHDRIIHCHVTIDLPHRHHRRGRHFQVCVDLKVPGAELAEHTTHENAQQAVSEAFRVARRRLQEHTRRIRELHRNHAA